MRSPLPLRSAAPGCAREPAPEPAKPAAPAETTAAAPAAPADTLVHLASPAPGDTVRSPLLVRGKARGFWFFEASFPVRLLAADGSELAVTYATAGSDWMTTAFVPFTSTVTFASPPAGTRGTLVLHKDNPSDRRTG